jgi:high-affinity nickel-transport protein
MSLVDSLDSILMLYAYAAPSRSTPEGRISLFQKSDGLPSQAEDANNELLSMPIVPTSSTGVLGEVSGDGAKDIEPLVKGPEGSSIIPPIASSASESDEVVNSRIVEIKTHAISSLSIVLTLLSILLALW